MKYRGSHSGNFNTGGGSGASSSSFYNHNHHQRSNGTDHGKSGRGYNDNSGGAGHGQIELVEKILSQISMHQTAGVTSSGNRGLTGITLTAGSSNNDRCKNSFPKKNPLQQYSNYNGASGDRGRHLALEVDNNEQCSRCEYVFTDGQLLPKFDCTHQLLGPVNGSSVGGGAKAPSPPLPSRGRENNASRDNGDSKFISKATSSKAYVNRNHKKGLGGGNQQHQAGNNVTVPSTHGFKAASPRQSIIPKKKCADMKKFVEAQIVFDHNMIDVVPVAGEGPCSFQLLNQPTKANVIIDSSGGIFSASVGALSSNKNAPVKKKKKSDVSEPVTVVMPETNPIEKRLKSIRELNSSDAASSSGGGCIGDKSMRRAKTDTNLSSATVGQTVAPLKSGSTCSVKPQQQPPQRLAKSKSVSSRTLELQPSTSKQSSAVGLSQPQTVKKIRCLIANFITIQVEDDLSEDCNDECLQKDIQQVIDCEKLGFQNFDGKNIGLYKNIGYINRNRAKFVRPTQELLQLMISPKLHAGQRASAHKLERTGAGQSEELELNLYQFYDMKSTDSYDKEYAYSVLESLIDDDGQLTGKIKARKYRYPEGEYSSELDDFLMSQQGPITTSHSASSSTGRPARSSPTDKSLPWSELEDNEVTMDSSSHSSPCPSKFTRYIRRSVCTSLSDDVSEEPEDKSLYGSYYITEVSFSAN